MNGLSSNLDNRCQWCFLSSVNSSNRLSSQLCDSFIPFCFFSLLPSTKAHEFIRYFSIRYKFHIRHKSSEKKVNQWETLDQI